MVELGSYVFLRRLDQAISALEIGIVLMHHAARGFALPQPLLDGRQGVNVLRMQESPHDAAIGMAADDDVGNLQDSHRLFDGRRAPALHRAIGWYHVTGVSENEELAGICLRQEGGIDSRVGTGKEKSGGAWFSESRVKSAFFLPNTSVRNFKNPLTSFSMRLVLPTARHSGYLYPP